MPEAPDHFNDADMLLTVKILPTTSLQKKATATGKTAAAAPKAAAVAGRHPANQSPNASPRTSPRLNLQGMAQVDLATDGAEGLAGSLAGEKPLQLSCIARHARLVGLSLTVRFNTGYQLVLLASLATESVSVAGKLTRSAVRATCRPYNAVLNAQCPLLPWHAEWTSPGIVPSPHGMSWR